MTLITEYLAANESYLDENSAAAISTLPDGTWSAILEALDELSCGARDPGIDCKVAITHETLDDFDAARTSRWSERGSRSEHEFQGLRALKFERFQLFRGQPRRDSVVVDLGDRRVALY